MYGGPNLLSYTLTCLFVGPSREDDEDDGQWATGLRRAEQDGAVTQPLSFRQTPNLSSAEFPTFTLLISHHKSKTKHGSQPFPSPSNIPLYPLLAVPANDRPAPDPQIDPGCAQSVVWSHVREHVPRHLMDRGRRQPICGSHRPSVSLFLYFPWLFASFESIK